VLITPVNRRTFDADGKIANSLGDYPDAVRQTAAEEGFCRQHASQQLRQLRIGQMHRRRNQGG